jgi:hypothetical protein
MPSLASFPRGPGGPAAPARRGKSEAALTSSKPARALDVTALVAATSRAAVAKLAAIAIAVAVVTSALPARAADENKSVAAASPEEKKKAGAAFAKGEKAFAAGKFAESAAAFEQAYRFVQHPSVIWNAARAWHKAGDLARAANLYEKYLQEAPDNAPDRKNATTGLEQLSAKLGRLDIYAPGVTEIAIDDNPVPSASPSPGAAPSSSPSARARVYVNPGTHIVRGKLAGREIKRTQAVEPGGVASVALAADESADKADPAKVDRGKENAAGPVKPKVDGADSGKPWKPIPKVAVIAGGAVTTVLLGVTIGSGIDTLNARSEYDAAPTQTRLNDGLGKQTRTNVLLGVTAGVAAVTAAMAIWFVEWGPPKGGANVGLGLGTVHASGSF